MPPPPWVIQSLTDILGLDSETIREVIVPDLEGYSSEVRLRGHLQDFLGSSAAARAFADRYVAHRFPSLAATVKPHVLTPDPNLEKPKKAKTGKTKGASSAAGSAVPSRSGTPSLPSNIPDALNAAFGTSGKVYQKQHDDFIPSRGGSASGGHRSQAGSGTQTPVRRAGAITITEVKGKPPAKDKGKAKEEKIWDVPKSKEVKRLEKIVEDLRAVRGEDKVTLPDKPPCFCQARVHPLSTYTPQCSSCGLILCDLQPPHAPCPSCARPTLSPPALAHLIRRVEGDIAAQISREEDAREEAERQRKERLLEQSGGGAFPSLPGNALGNGPRKSVADATRRVLTIGKPGKGKGRATLTTTRYTSTPTPPSSSKVDAEVDEVDEVVRRPRSPPPDAKTIGKEIAKAQAWRDENDRPWGDPKAERRGETWAYVAPLVIELPGVEGTGRRRKAKQKKNVGLDGRVVVGAAH